MVVAAIAAVLGLSGSALTQDPEPDVFRVEHVYPGAVIARVHCASDFCGIGAPPVVDATIPASLGDVDLTASLTIEYRTTPGDGPLVDTKIDPPNGPLDRMAPGLLAVRAGPKTVTTLTWVRHGIDPSLGTFGFQWQLETYQLDRPFTVVVTEAVLVIEATPV